MRAKREALPRFLVVGGATAVASALAIHLLVRYANLEAIAGAAIVAIAGNAIGFVANRQWSFLASHAHPWAQFLRYMAVAASATLASVGLFALLTDFAGLHYVVASLCVSTVFAVTNFVAHFHWSFTAGSTDTSA